MRDVDLWWQGNLTTGALVSLVDKTEWGYMTVLWLLAPVCEGFTYVIVMGCLTHPHKLQGNNCGP